MTAGGKFVPGSRDALEMRPFGTVPQRIGRPILYGEALRRADMLQEIQFKQSGLHRTLRGHSRSAAREFPLGVIPDTADNLGSCGVKGSRNLRGLKNYTPGAFQKDLTSFTSRERTREAPGKWNRDGKPC